MSEPVEGEVSRILLSLASHPGAQEGATARLSELDILELDSASAMTFTPLSHSRICVTSSARR